MRVVNDTYDSATNEHSIDCGSDMLTDLSLLTTMTLAESGEPNAVARRVVNLSEEMIDETGPTLTMPVVEHKGVLIWLWSEVQRWAQPTHRLLGRRGTRDRFRLSRTHRVRSSPPKRGSPSSLRV